MSPADTIVERTGKKLRTVLFDGGSPSSDVSRTVHIAHENITKPWKKQQKYAKMYRPRNEQQDISVSAPVPPSTINDTSQVSTLEHFHRSSERHHGCCPTSSSEDDSGLMCLVLQYEPDTYMHTAFGSSMVW